MEAPQSSAGGAGGPEPGTQGQAPAGSRGAEAAQAGTGVRQHRFSAELLDELVHFQVLDLGRQLLVWVGRAPARLGDLALAGLPGGGAAPRLGLPNGGAHPTPGPAADPPPVTVLGRQGGSAGVVATSMARRLALRLAQAGRGHGPLALACDLPEGEPRLAALAERRLVEELVALGLLLPG